MTDVPKSLPKKDLYYSIVRDAAQEAGLHRVGSDGDEKVVILKAMSMLETDLV